MSSQQNLMIVKNVERLNQKIAIHIITTCIAFYFQTTEFPRKLNSSYTARQMYTHFLNESLSSKIKKNTSIRKTDT